MAYSDFTLIKVKQLGLTLNESQRLFAQVDPVQPSDFLALTLREYLPLATAINTKKARSELLITPVLTEIRRQLKSQMSFFSGTEFNVDPDRGLQGFCDYILSRSTEQFDITAPVVTIVEAKNESLKGGLGQCIAFMLAAQTFNQNAGNGLDVIYGAVTSGTNWRFLTLSDSLVHIDSTEYFINEVDKILGILLQPFQAVLTVF
ncbi:MAG: hypothetical protein KME11_17770 [Timaviella obliquedivisa GSE-PSE-MK23-08B]|jgi:hypothetical protein|nr:hypothetical protein [Timaviella obliquedivisa GSE-PSE-MK23-08B]